jgi:hypothetical protein
LHAEQTPPKLPHTLNEVPNWQVPLVSQHPLKQLDVLQVFGAGPQDGATEIITPAKRPASRYLWFMVVPDQRTQPVAPTTVARLAG